MSSTANYRGRSTRVRRRRLFLESLETRDLLAADTVRVLIENLSPEGGLGETPFWLAFHDGNFDVANLGEAAEPDLELLAETGDASQLVARFAAEGNGNDAVVTAPDGFAGAPVFEPGETVTFDLDVDDTQIGRYFSYASMLIPSNDAFVANLDPQQYELFDAGGMFLGPISITIWGGQVWDAGTEVNDPFGDAAFSTEGGTAVDENGVIHLHEGLDDFIGTGLPTGENLESAFTDQTPLARITLSLASNPSGPIDEVGPVAALDASDLTERADFHEIRVIYSDPSGIDLTSIDVNDIRVTSPSLAPLDVLSVTTDAAAGTTPRTVTATYRVAPTTGAFTHIDNGVNLVTLQPGEVNDPLGHASTIEALGEFSVTAPVRLQLTVESLGPDGGLAQTPFWLAVHNGNFATARTGVAASEYPGLELIAEEGDPSELSARFQASATGVDTVLTAPDGFAGAPVFEPGESVSGFIDVHETDLYRFFSYASMIIPSNDAFVANVDPRRYELFDRFGNFTGARSIVIYGDDIWDAGTEVNDPAGGAAFSTAGGTSADENGVVHRHQGLDDFVGTGLPTGENLESAFGGNTPIARLTISLADAPAAPLDHRGPLASLHAGDVATAGADFHEIQVVYDDASGIDVASLGVDDLLVAGSNGRVLNVTEVTTDAAPGTSPRTVTATYRIEPADGPFSTFDNAIYQVSLNNGAVNDIFSNDASGEPLGSFSVFVGVRLQITIENLSPVGGLAQTPFWVGLHDGNFEIGRTGVAASQFGGLELLAEEGDTSELVNRFATTGSGLDAVVTAPDGFAGAPVFEPGESVTHVLELFNTDVNRYFSFASMLIPSNDAFIANLNPRQYPLFENNGAFRGARTITIFGDDVWDAGTEINAPDGGAAFATAGGASADENGVVHSHQGLDDFIGAGLPTGEMLQSAFGDRTPLARITISLESASASAIDTEGPTATLQASGVTEAGLASHEIQVTYDDPSGLDLTRFGTDDIRVVGPLGRELQVTNSVVHADTGTTPNSATVTYTLATGDGPFTARDNGRYSVLTNPGAAGDTLGHGNPIQELGAFTVDTGVRVQVQIEALAPQGGFGQTPFWLGFHNGEFEVGRAGIATTDFPGLELLAEEGDPGELDERFANSNNGISAVVASPEGFPGAPVFEPGETVARVIEIAAPNVNRYFSYASMVIPSNDAFVANLDPRQIALFDTNGNFQGARSFTITAADIWDAGTEVNNPFGGAAYSTEGGEAVNENGVVHQHSGLNDFLGTGLPTGEMLTAGLDASTPLARITVTLVDPPASACSGVVGACSVRSVSLQNQQLALDVNNDGGVSPIDALQVVNFLNGFGTQPTIADEARALDLFLDSNGDGLISPIDALLVINRLNELSGNVPPSTAANELPQPEGEFTAVDSAFAAFDFRNPAEAADDEEDDERDRSLELRAQLAAEDLLASLVIE